VEDCGRLWKKEIRHDKSARFGRRIVYVPNSGIPEGKSEALGFGKVSVARTRFSVKSPTQETKNREGSYSD